MAARKMMRMERAVVESVRLEWVTSTQLQLEHPDDLARYCPDAVPRSASRAAIKSSMPCASTSSQHRRLDKSRQVFPLLLLLQEKALVAPRRSSRTPSLAERSSGQDVILVSIGRAEAST